MPCSRSLAFRPAGQRFLQSCRIRDLTLSPPETRASLILRLPDAADIAAWDEVVAVYGPLLYRLARRKGLQPNDADDLVQEVLTAVASSVEQWLQRSDRGRFRVWLMCIARNTAINFLTRPKYRLLSPGGSAAANALAALATPDVSHEFDFEYRRESFRWASRQVRETLADNTWAAFWLTTMEERPVAEVAEELDMTPGSIYIARSRIMTKLRALVRQLEEREQ